MSPESAPTARRDEFDLIDWIRQRSQIRQPVELGIGDDTAVLAGPSPGEKLLVTTDMLIEGWHFTLDTASPGQIGRKALAVNLSDIAAMAGRPTAAFLSIALPKSSGRSLAEGIYAGLLPLADEFGVTIAGGDTNSWNGPLVINVTLTGETTGGRAVTRSGARPGDELLVTGPLGGSRGGREFSFLPRLAAAQKLHRLLDLHAMIDLSDGLSADLPHLARESGVCATLRADHIPIHDELSSLPRDEQIQRALSDGEDFELLIAVSPEDLARIQQGVAGIPLFPVGRVEAGSGCFVEKGGNRQPLEPTGWTHRFG